MNPQIEKILKLPAKIRVAILVALVVLEIVGFYFMMYAPRLEELSELKSELAKKEAQVKQKQVIASGLEQFKAQYAKAQLELKAALEKLPEKSEIPSLLTSVSTLAKDQGMTIDLFKPQGESKKDFYAQVNVGLKMRGSFHDTALFFDSVGNLKRIVNIGDFTIRRGRSTAGETAVDVECAIQTYRFLDSSELAAKKTPQKKKKR